MKTSSNKRDFQIFIFVRAPSKISLLKMLNAWKRRETIENIESSWVLENSVDSNIWRKKTQIIWDRWGIWPVIGTLPQRRGHWLSSGEPIAVTSKPITGCYKHCGRGRWQQESRQWMERAPSAWREARHRHQAPEERSRLVRTSPAPAAGQRVCAGERPLPSGDFGVPPATDGAFCHKTPTKNCIASRCTFHRQAGEYHRSATTSIPPKNVWKRFPKQNHLEFKDSIFSKYVMLAKLPWNCRKC